MLLSIFSTSHLCSDHMRRFLLDTLVSLVSCYQRHPHSWLWLEYLNAVRHSVFLQSPGDCERMKWVLEGSLSKTGSSKRDHYYALKSEHSLSHSLSMDVSFGKKGSSAANASRWNMIMNTTVSHLFKTLL